MIARFPECLEGLSRPIVIVRRTCTRGKIEICHLAGSAVSGKRVRKPLCPTARSWASWTILYGVTVIPASAPAEGDQLLATSLAWPPAMTPEKVAYELPLLDEPDRTMTSIAELLGVLGSTLYPALLELQAAERGCGGLDSVLTQLPPGPRLGPPTLEEVRRPALTGHCRRRGPGR